MKLSEVSLDVQAIEDGVWRPHPYFDGVMIRVRGSRSDAVEKRRRALLNRLPQKRRKLGDSVAETEKVEALCTAECLLEVKGIDDVTYTSELGVSWAKEPGMRRFMAGVREVAEEIGDSEQQDHEESVSD